jgi:uncharacterized protein YndB with AHSA1/START domain
MNLEDLVMVASKPTSNPDSIVSEIHIAAPRQRVFEALTLPDQVVKWWGQAGIYRSKEFSADVRVGGKWRTAGLDGEGRPFEAFGEYLEVDPPRLLAYSWMASWTGDIKTTVRWELEPASNGTLIRITHSGFAAHPELANAYRGWPRMLGWLQAYLDRGETVEDRKPASWS